MKELPNHNKVLELVGSLDYVKDSDESVMCLSDLLTTGAPDDPLRRSKLAQQHDQQIRPDSDLGFLREMVEIIIKDAVLAGMDRNTLPPL